MCQNYKAKVNCLLYRIILVLFFYWILPVISIDAKRRLCFIWTFKTWVIIILFSLISAVIEIRPNYFCSLISTNFTLQGQTCHEQTWSFFFFDCVITWSIVGCFLRVQLNKKSLSVSSYYLCYANFSISKCQLLRKLIECEVLH